MAMVEIPRTSTPYPINNRKRKFLTQREESPSPSKKNQTHTPSLHQIHSNLQQQDLLSNPININNSINNNNNNNNNNNINKSNNNNISKLNANLTPSQTNGGGSHSSAAMTAATTTTAGASGNSSNSTKTNSISAATTSSGNGAGVGGSNLSDEYGVFGEYVAITIRKLKTSKAKIVVKHLINNLLYEAEMGKYDHGIPSSKEPPQLYKM